MSSTAFRNHCLLMIILYITFPINLGEKWFLSCQQNLSEVHDPALYKTGVSTPDDFLNFVRRCELLTLPSCKHQEKHKENQAQSLHVWATKAFRHCCGQADPAFILHLNQGGGVCCAHSIITITGRTEWGQSEGLRSGLFMHLIQYLQLPVNLKFKMHVYLVFGPFNV